MNLTKNKKSRKEKIQEKIKKLKYDLLHGDDEYRESFIKGYYTLFKIAVFSVGFNCLTAVLLIILFSVKVLAV